MRKILLFGIFFLFFVTGTLAHGFLPEEEYRFFFGDDWETILADHLYNQDLIEVDVLHEGKLFLQRQDKTEEEIIEKTNQIFLYWKNLGYSC